MNFCEKCGQKLNGENFCPNCGQQIINSNEKNNTSASPQKTIYNNSALTCSNTNNVTAAVPKKEIKIGITHITVISIILVVLIVFIAVFSRSCSKLVIKNKVGSLDSICKMIGKSEKSIPYSNDLKETTNDSEYGFDYVYEYRIPSDLTEYEIKEFGGTPSNVDFYIYNNKICRIQIWFSNSSDAEEDFERWVAQKRLDGDVSSNDDDEYYINIGKKIYSVEYVSRWDYWDYLTIS